MIDEHTLLKKAIAGNASAFEQLVLQYQTKIYNLCLQMLNNPDDAADMTQEAFLKAWRGLKTFHFDAAFSTWLYRLASNVCIDFLRREKRQRTIPLVFPDEQEQVIEIQDPSPTPEVLTIRAEERKLLADAMSRLNIEHRQILTLRVINALSYADIASILGIKEGTVKSRLARARASLRKKILQTGNNRKTTSSKDCEEAKL